MLVAICQDNRLVSREGFEHISSLLVKGISREVLEQILDSIPISSPDVEVELKYEKKVFGTYVKKAGQIKGLLKLVKTLKPKRIVEIGSGSGWLTRELALNFPGAEVLGVDKNKRLVEKQNGRVKFDNLSFESADAFEYKAPNNTDLVVSLHTCGNLTDRVIDIALNVDSDVVCVPCCYGLIKRFESQEGEYFLPRSKTLSDKKEHFREVLIRRARKLDGETDGYRRGRRNVLLDLYRLLINFDRVFYMREKGCKVNIHKITGLKTDGCSNSSLRYALFGQRNS